MGSPSCCPSSAFFLFFGVLEDSGYLPRLTVMANRTFRPMGLNGKAVLPMVLGLGCGTMATLTARIMDSRKAPHRHHPAGSRRAMLRSTRGRAGDAGQYRRAGGHRGLAIVGLQMLLSGHWRTACCPAGATTSSSRFHWFAFRSCRTWWSRPLARGVVPARGGALLPIRHFHPVCAQSPRCW